MISGFVNTYFDEVWGGSIGTRTISLSFDLVALEESLARRHRDCDSILGIHSVVQVIAAPGVIDVHVIVVVPIV